MRALFFLGVLGCATLTGCGVPGAPQPPSTGIPKFVGDLKAVRKGETVALRWTTPTQTSDGELIRKPGKMLVQRALSSGRNAELNFQTVSEQTLPPALKNERGDQATANDSLTDLLRSNTNDQFAVYSVLAQSRSGKSAGLPNRVSVPLVPTLPTPQKIQAEVVPTGIRISWDQSWPPNKESSFSLQYVYRIMRRLEGATDAMMVKQVRAGNEALIFVDDGIEWEKNYQYWIVPVTLWLAGERRGEVESDDSPTVTVFAHDIFPPAAPAGLQAVYSAVPGSSFIDLTWTPNGEPDLAGYNVYRHTGSEPPVKINTELVKTPRFADPGIQHGMKYFYSVTAVDLRGNESGKSEETSEIVPRE
ncbi:MAG TPA: fibronectin type III domain-containing protein [Candidatus Angelobacter sp.]|nr:fibronectin type III domain-containing protein [Candidatus Angelobacter sp.]